MVSPEQSPQAEERDDLTPQSSQPLSGTGVTRRPPAFRKKLDTFMFGSDVFISYARSDAIGYALRLATRLIEGKLSCYLDQWGTPPGRELPPELRSALARSSMLVLIATRGAIASESVAAEVTEFARTRRPIVIVDVGNVVSTARWWHQVQGVALTKETEEAVVRQEPSEQVITRVVNSISFTTSSRRIRRAAWATLALMVVVVASGMAGAAYYGAKARTAAERAEHERQLTRIAEEQTKQARSEAASASVVASQEREEAERQTRLARDAEIVRTRAEEDARKAEFERGQRAQEAVARALAMQAGLEVKAREEELGALLAKQAFLFARRAGGNAVAQADAALRAATEIEFFGRTRQSASSISDWIRATAFHPDGQVLFVATGDGVRMEVMGRSDPTVEVLPIDTTCNLVRLAVSHNGQYLAVGGFPKETGRACLWLVPLGTQPAQPVPLLLPSSSLEKIGFEPKGRTLITVSGDSLLEWSLDQSDHPAKLRWRHPGLTSFAVSPSDGTVMVGSDQGEVFLLAPGVEEKGPLISTALPIRDIALTSNGRLVTLSCSSNLLDERCRLQVWDLDSPKAARVTMDVSAAISLAVHPTAEIAAIGTRSGSVIVSDLDLGTAIASLPHHGWVEALSFSSDGKLLASGDSYVLTTATDIRLRVWRFEEPVGRPPSPRFGMRVSSLAFSHDGRQVALTGFEGSVRLWTLGTPADGDLLFQQKRVNGAYQVGFQPDTNTLWSWGEDGHLRSWDTLTKRNTRDTPFDRPIRSVAFHPKRPVLVVVTQNEQCLLYVVTNDGIKAAAPTEDGCYLQTAVFNHDGSRLYAGDYKGNLWLYEPERAFARTLLATAAAPPLRALATSPNDDTVAFGDAAGTVYLRQRLAGKYVERRLGGHTSGVRSLAFNPDGTLLASGGDDQTVRVWSVGRPEESPLVLRHEGGRVEDLAFDPHDPVVAAANGAGLVIWLIDTKLLADWVCELTWRDLTRQEWDRYIGPEYPYEATCAKHPELR